jgi:hypothetical protein
MHLKVQGENNMEALYTKMIKEFEYLAPTDAEFIKSKLEDGASYEHCIYKMFHKLGKAKNLMTYLR